MNQKQVGIALIIAGVLLAGMIFSLKMQEDTRINMIIQQQGTCFLKDGTCLHATQNYTLFIFGWILSVGLVILGVYLIFFDRTQQMLAQQHLEVSSALKEAKKQEKDKDEFHAFLSGFSADEQAVLKAVKEQEGILQSTLRYRTGMSKTTLSLLLKSLEERKIVSRKPAGKTNMIFLIKHF
jgi:uncharacterized membrane protein